MQDEEFTKTYVFKEFMRGNKKSKKSLATNSMQAFQRLFILMHSSGCNVQLGESNRKALLDSLEGPFFNEAAMHAMEAQFLSVIVELKEKLAADQPDEYEVFDCKMTVIANQMRNNRISARSNVSPPVPLRSASMKKRHCRRKELENAEQL